MSYAGASLLLILILLGLAAYFVVLPPPGFEEHVLHRLAIPLLLVAVAFGVLENLRTRAHLSQLVGALRSLMGRRGNAASPAVRAEAVEILLRSLREGKEDVRGKAVEQLRRITGADPGEDAEAWEAWWRENRARFLSGPEGREAAQQ